MKIVLFLIISVNILCKEIILLLGGINRLDATYMNKLKETLSQNEREVIDDIESDTFNHSITTQADIVYSRLIEKGITNQDKIVIIGHSQGGLRGYEISRKYRNSLNILALITISTPWGGAGVLNKLDEFKERLSRINIIMNKTDFGYSELRYDIYKKIDRKYVDMIPEVEEFLDKCQNSLGTNDMKIDSPYINTLEPLDIPVFNIVGSGISISDIIADEVFEEAENSLYEGVDKVNKESGKKAKRTARNAASLGICATGAASAMFAPVIAPFLFLGFIFTTTLVSVPLTVIEGYKNELIDDINYIRLSLRFLKDFKVNLNNPRESDLILSVDEQKLPDPIKETFIIKNFYQIYGNQQFEVQRALHDTLPFQDRGKVEEIENMLVYSNQQTLNIIKEKVNILFR